MAPSAVSVLTGFDCGGAVLGGNMKRLVAISILDYECSPIFPQG